MERSAHSRLRGRQRGSHRVPLGQSGAIAAIGGFFRGIGEFFVGIWRWFVGIFQAIADGIMSFLQPVVDFFRGVGRAIQSVFDAIKDMVIRILRNIPDALLPESLERLSRQPLSTEVRTEDSFAAALHRPRPAYPPLRGLHAPVRRQRRAGPHLL